MEASSFSCRLHLWEAASWPAFFSNPNGIVSSSPGLRGTSYPGFGKRERPNRNAVASHTSRLRRYRVAVDAVSITASQGSSATLGFAPKSRWDSILRFASAGTSAASRIEALTVAVGFSPRFGAEFVSRRVATFERLVPLRIKRRSATQRASAMIRGLKPTATISPSLRDDKRAVTSGPEEAITFSFTPVRRRFPESGWNGPLARCGGRPARRSACAVRAPFGSSDFRAEARRQVSAENGPVARSTNPFAASLRI